ncbi:MAG TPA: hypothetical protein DEP18_05755 [Flavobacteriales bacterium]|nr:hypothetical protein [Flavobacteriales bacterium]
MPISTRFAARDFIRTSLGGRLLFFLFLYFELSSTRAGNTCAGADAIIPNGTCSTLRVDGGAGTPALATCTGTIAREEWFSFTATAGVTYTASYTNSTNNTNPGIYVYSGACGGLTQIACVNATGMGNPVTETLNFTPGSSGTFYIRMVNFGTTNNMDGTLCLTSAAFLSNDEPTGATALSPGTTCSFSTYTNYGATASTCGTIPAPGCAGYIGSDVWFSIVVPATGSLIINSQAGVITDGGMALYTGAPCGTLTLVSCNDNGTGMPTITATNLTPASTVYVRFWEDGNNNNGTFGICVIEPPSNDEPTTATALTPGTSCSFSTFTNLNATASTCGTIPAPGCATYAGGDVWFSIVVPATGSLIISSQAGVITDGGMALYTGTPCGTLSLVSCNDNGTGMPTITATNLTPSSTVYVRFWEDGNNNNGTFGICVIQPPANDEPSTAISLTPGATCSFSTFTNLNATTSTCGTIPAPGCGGYSGGDVWFSFVVPPSGYVTISAQAGVITDGAMAIYSGSPCGILTLISCNDNGTAMPTITSNTLTPGATIYIRFWEDGNNNNGTFGICVTDPCSSSSPVNNDCSTATPLTVYASSCVPLPGTVQCASASADANSCGATADDDDVWYSFVATSTSVNITITSVAGSVTDMYHSLFTGTCGSLGNAVLCSDPNSSTPTGLTIGQTYYIRVYTVSTAPGQTTTFQICVTQMSPCGNPMNNDFCSTPATLSLSASSTFSSTTASSYTADNPANINTAFSCGTIQNNSWYQFTATATSHTINISSIAGCTGGIQAQVYAVTRNANNCCTNFSSVSNCYSPGNTNPGTLTANGLTIGNTYVLMIDGWSGANCNYTIAGWSASGVLPIELISFDGMNIGNGNELRWKTATESNNERFDIERSYDGSNFIVIGSVAGSGNSTVPLSYQFFDGNTVQGHTYYRLRQFDFNGENSTSQTIVVFPKENNEAFIYPNPASDKLNIDVYNEFNTRITVRIIDLAGHVFEETFFAEEGVNHFNSSHFSSLEKGVYFVQITTPSGMVIKTEKIIKQ